MLEEIFSILGYVDDLKPAVNDMEEVEIIIRQCTKLEKASGVKLHREPLSGKCKMLPLGKWNNSLKQEMIPFNFIKLMETLDVMGVKLCSKYQLTRAKNSEMILDKVERITNMWRSGRVMALVDRAHALNSNVLSTVWFRTSSIPLKKKDINNLTKAMKS